MSAGVAIAMCSIFLVCCGATLALAFWCAINAKRNPKAAQLAARLTMKQLNWWGKQFTDGYKAGYKKELHR